MARSSDKLPSCECSQCGHSCRPTKRGIRAGKTTGGEYVSFFCPPCNRFFSRSSVGERPDLYERWLAQGDAQPRAGTAVTSGSAKQRAQQPCRRKASVSRVAHQKRKHSRSPSTSSSGESDQLKSSDDNGNADVSNKDDIEGGQSASRKRGRYGKRVPCAVSGCSRDSRQDCTYVHAGGSGERTRVCKDHCTGLNLSACPGHGRLYSVSSAPSSTQPGTSRSQAQTTVTPAPKKRRKTAVDGDPDHLPGHDAISLTVQQAARTPQAIQRIRHDARLVSQPSLMLVAVIQNVIRDDQPEVVVRYLHLTPTASGVIDFGSIPSLHALLSSHVCFSWNFHAAEWDVIAPLTSTFSTTTGPLLFFLSPNLHDSLPGDDHTTSVVAELNKRHTLTTPETHTSTPAPAQPQLSLRRNANSTVNDFKLIPDPTPFTPTVSRHVSTIPLPNPGISSSSPRVAVGDPGEAPHVEGHAATTLPLPASRNGALKGVIPRAGDDPGAVPLSRTSREALGSGQLTVGTVVDFFLAHRAYGRDDTAGRAAQQAFNLHEPMPESTFNRWKVRALAIFDAHHRVLPLPNDIASQPFQKRKRGN